MPTNETQSQRHHLVVHDPRKEGATEHGVARTWRVATVVLAGLLLAGAAYAAFGNSTPKQDFSNLPTAPVRRDKLQVKVTEGGTLIARKSLEIKSKVEGRRTILEVVPEGTVITEKDVDDGMVLVRLDVSDLEERQGSREISYLSAEAANTKAKEDYDIQVKQNESDIALAQLNVKFARMELERYLGAPLAQQILDKGLDSVDLDALANEEVRKSLLASGQGEQADAASVGEEMQAQVEQVAGPTADGEVVLGGAARQQIHTYSSDVQLAGVELTQARERYEDSQNLAVKKYISANDLKKDELDAQQKDVGLVSAQEELRLFLRYGLPKEVEQRVSDYVEAQRDLERAQARARSQLAQAEAERRSRQQSFDLEKQRRDDMRETLENAVIRAPKPGRVVYATTTDAWRRMRDPMREGKEVHQNESLLILPDLSTLAAQVNVHETDIEKVHVGQPAVVTVEAMPGRRFPGKVVSVSPVASAAQAWLNPDIKVYQTDVAIDDAQEGSGLTPGMSATAEILIADLKDVLQVPIEAISAHKGGHICWVKTDGDPEMREVECGYFTKTTVEIRSGLKEGEVVYLEPPYGLSEEVGGDQDLQKQIAAAKAAIAEAGPSAPADQPAEGPRDSAGRAERRRQGEGPPGAGGRQGEPPSGGGGGGRRRGGAPAQAQ
jgi:HlyD family secretion protein